MFKYLLLALVFTTVHTKAQEKRSGNVEILTDASPTHFTANDKDGVILDYTPKSGNMLGGSMVNITGSFFKPTDQIVCIFDNMHGVSAMVLNSTAAICLQPMLPVEGYVNLQIAMSPGNSILEGEYYAESFLNATQKIFTSYSNEICPPEVKLHWNPKNFTLQAFALSHLALWGYKDSSERPEIFYIDDLATIPNIGRFLLIPRTYKNRNNEKVLDVNVGFIKINATVPVGENNHGNITLTIWSRPIPLGWYFLPQWKRNYDQNNWLDQLCDIWLENATSQWYRGLTQFVCRFWLGTATSCKPSML